MAIARAIADHDRRTTRTAVLCQNLVEFVLDSLFDLSIGQCPCGYGDEDRKCCDQDCFQESHWGSLARQKREFSGVD
jgi:hypothetical protein